ncbi:MAG TPA: hypothetical protein PKD55_02585 [Bellilinea sp.]|nr:hypothetical protein [Bellilinea sp.]
MAKFRKKPIIVEAEQFLPNDQPLPFKDRNAVEWAGGRWYVVTAHGKAATIVDGDWIVREPDNRGFYPVKADIFEKTYEPTEQASEVEQLRADLDAALTAVQALVDLVQSNMDENCAWCMGHEGQHEPDCEAMRVLFSPVITDEEER